MNILITGGAGYVGAPLTAELLERGHSVTILDNFMYGTESILHLASNPRLSVMATDVRTVDAAALRPFDAVLHLAGLSGFPACQANPHAAQSINVDASRRLAEVLSPQQVLVYASTTSIYGAAGDVCDETAHVAPVSGYGRTKLEGERAVLAHPNAIALRFATVFGNSSRMRIDLLVNDFTHRAMYDRVITIYDGKSKRTFMHIQDTLQAYVFALENSAAMAGQVFNVGSNSLNLSKDEIAAEIQRVTGCSVLQSELPDPDRRDFSISFDKIHGLGYRTKHSLSAGVAEMARLFSFHRPFATFRPI